MAGIHTKERKAGRLTLSAFACLGVSIRASKTEILEAYDERLFEGVGEEALSAARSRLTLARDRLGEELRFLPDLSPARSRQLLDQLLTAHEHEVERISTSLPNLSRVNVCFDALERFGPAALDDAIDAHRDFDPDAAREAIDQTRAASGFAPIANDAWSREIKAFQGEQAQALFKALSQSERPSEVLTKLMGAEGKRSRWFASVIDALTDQYDRWSEPRLVEIEEGLDRAIAGVREAPADPEARRQIEALLADWDAINQPVQLRDEAKGLDEPKSKRLFDKVRALAVWLANTCDEYTAAYELARALERTFPELPSVVAQLAIDLETLSGLAEHARSQELVQPLVDAAERAKANLSRFASQVLRGQFSAHGSGLAGDLYSQHAVAAALSHDLTPADLPWQIVRTVAVDLNNDTEEPAAALIVIETIARNAPDSIAEQLQTERTTLRGLSLQKQCQQAIHLRDLKRALEFANTIVAECPDQREQFTRIRDGLEQRIAQRKRSFWTWGIIASVIGAVAALDNSRPSSTSYDPGSSYDPSQADETMNVDAPLDTTADTAAEPQAGAAAETPPPLEHYGPLSLSELRYCKFEERRVEMLDSRVRPSAYSQFNQKVADFNSRCSHGQYRLSDETTVTGELASAGDQLEQQVAATLAEWEPAPVAFDSGTSAAREAPDTDPYSYAPGPGQDGNTDEDDPLLSGSNSYDEGE